MVKDLYPFLSSSEDIRVNTIVKRYPDGSAVITAANRRVFRVPGWEAVKQNPRETYRMDDETAYGINERRGIAADGGYTEGEVAALAANLDRAQRRARTAVRDLALANPFRFFVTLTFDKAKVDRWDDREVLRVTKNWLDNAVRRYGLAYVLVAERHKDGAIHFHGFFNDVLEGVDSGHKTSRGQIIYNLPRWPWGFTTAIEVYGDYGAAVSYVCKYITKGTEKVGGRWYYHGGALKKPDVEYVNTDLFDTVADGEKVAINGLKDVEVTIIKTGGLN